MSEGIWKGFKGELNRQRVKDVEKNPIDLAIAVEIPTAQREVNLDRKDPAVKNQNSEVRSEAEQFGPFFPPDVAKDFRLRWDAVQMSFIDDPRQAARQGDELVAQVRKNITDIFSQERANLEAQLAQTDKASTENLRVTMRRYRSFFERILAL